MKAKLILGIFVIAAAMIFGAVSFIESNVEYADFETARGTAKKIQVKGEWIREKESRFVPEKSEFIFFMRDDNGEEMKVTLDGAKPNNFEIATSIVVKGRYRDGGFHATEILTKCPSKYEGDVDSMKKTL